MNYEARIKEWIKTDIERSKALEFASGLGLKDWCLAAGFVRNLVWDRLHGNELSTALNDIDLIYFNANDSSEQTDRHHEQYLKSLSHYPWSVKNQARMHITNMDCPYLSTADAMSYWVELETAIGVRLSKNNDLELVAPFGLGSLFENTITINNKRRKTKEFKARIKDKKWLEHWPNLKIIA